MATFYVSPSGSDSASGTSATAGGAFATLARAQQAMRASPGADTTQVMDGTYFVGTGLNLTAADNGSSFVAMAGANPVISGGAPVSGWTAGSDGIWRATVNAASVTQFTVGGVAQTEARTPNATPAQPLTGGWLWARDLPSGHDASMEMAYDKATLAAGQLSVGAKVTVFTQGGYETDVLTIASIDTNAGIVRFVSPANDDLGAGSRFFVSGRAAQLDQPGEWWFDPASHTLSYKPQPGFTGSGAVASGGNQPLVSVSGASNVTLQGLAFENVGSTAAQNEDATAAINLLNSTAVTIAGNSFRNVPKGVVLDDGAHHNTVTGNSFAHLAGNAIQLTPTSHENQVTDNTIQDVSAVYRAGGAIEISESWGNRIAHNTIQDVPRFGIAEFNYTTGIKSGGNTIEYNTVLRSGQQTTDVGAIYAFSAQDGAELGDIIRYNKVVDTGGLATTATGFVAGPKLSWGIYLDDETSNAEVYGNFVSGTTHGGVMLHGGNNNHVYNNILLDNDVFGIEVLELDHAMTGTTIHHNLVEIPNDPTSPVVSLDTAYVPAAAVHDNIYLSPTGAAPVVADRSYTQWRAAGGDAGSDIVTTAGFVDPAGGNYAFRPDAFALTQGISQLPWASMATTATVTPPPVIPPIALPGPSDIGLATPYVLKAEGKAGTSTTFSYTVTRSGATEASATVDWSLAGGGAPHTAAVDATDFASGQMPAAGTLTFAPGQTSQTVEVSIAGDSLAEPIESFTISLANPTGGASLTTTEAIGVVYDSGIYGTLGADTLVGTAADDVFVVGSGADSITGGAGHDEFRFLQSSLSPAGANTKTITDFDPAGGELLDLSRIDAIAGTLANDSFTFIGTAAFDGTPGQLRWQDDGATRLIQGNTNTDLAADLSIRVATAGPADSTWFIL